MTLTIITEDRTSPSVRPGAVPPLRIALAGYGVVGQALRRRLAARPEFEIAAILVRDPARERAVPPPVTPTRDADALLSVRADLLIDVLSCARTGAALSEAALGAGLDVVSASKRVIAANHRRLSSAARARGGRLLYSAAVGGGAPVLETVAAARRQGPVREVRGILNGTVNFILDLLSAGRSFDAALAEAQAAGFAEEDPHEDLSGADAAAKLRLIAVEAFGVDPDEAEIAVEPLDPERVARIASDERRWVQLARIGREGGRISGSVRLVPAGPEAPALPGEFNWARAELADGAALSCEGRGAGGDPTACAILADLQLLCASATPVARAA
ncbi:MAG: hypothetical protein ACK4K7_01945 [Allosphingosinicella sp.]|uniref:hypothetical protein n=1 Tax=Allosphingosinicella sp. TaxID=2823234 RepID=UPI00393D9D9B